MEKLLTSVSEFIREKRVMIAIMLLVLAGGIGLFAYQIKPAPKPQSVSLQKIENSQPEVTVEITKDGFMPQTIKVKKSGVVNFINQDSKPHLIASDPHPSHTLYPFLNTDETLNKNGSVSITFEKTGTFTYHDHLNPLKYKGAVIVE